MPTERLKTVDAGPETWSLEPFPLVGSGLAGRIDVKAQRAVLTARHTAQSMRGVLQFSSAKISFEVLDGNLAGGRLAGDIAFFSSPDGMSALSYLELTGASAAEVIPTEGQPPIKGALSIKATVEGAGLTPAAFMGSLHGNGEITIDKGEFAGLNPTVFDALTRAVDLGVRADTKQIKEFVVLLLDNGQLSAARAHSKITFVGGQVRLLEPRVEAKGAEVAIAGAVDLANATVDATITLSGPPAGDVAGRPAVTMTIKGAFAAPNRTVNADSLAGWLALRSVERQSKRLETIEAARRAALAQPLADFPGLSFAPAAPVGRAGEEDDSKSPPAQSTIEPAVRPAEATAGIMYADQPPPLPPPIVIEPSEKPQARPSAPPRRGNAPPR
jgi:large subunit ribosomal protein L24